MCECTSYSHHSFQSFWPQPPTPLINDWNEQTNRVHYVAQFCTLKLSVICWLRSCRRSNLNRNESCDVMWLKACGPVFGMDVGVLNGWLLIGVGDQRSCLFTKNSVRSCSHSQSQICSATGKCW